MAFPCAPVPEPAEPSLEGYDEGLVHNVRFLATGAMAHKVESWVFAYKRAYQLLHSGRLSAKGRAGLAALEGDMRRFVARERLSRYEYC